MVDLELAWEAQRAGVPLDHDEDMGGIREDEFEVRVTRTQDTLPGQGVPSLEEDTEPEGGTRDDDFEAPVPPTQDILPGHQPRVVPFPKVSAGWPLESNPTAFATYEKKLGSSSTTNIYAPFKSQIDFQFAHWAKVRGPSSTALTELLQIKGVSARALSRFTSWKLGH